MCHPSPSVSWSVRDVLHKVPECASTGINVYICEWSGRVIQPYDIGIYISQAKKSTHVSAVAVVVVPLERDPILSDSLPRRSGFMIPKHRTGDRMNLHANKKKKKFIESEFRLHPTPHHTSTSGRGDTGTVAVVVVVVDRCIYIHLYIYMYGERHIPYSSINQSIIPSL
jgi:hypothetical protein